jgi:hypothetical protein
MNTLAPGDRRQLTLLAVFHGLFGAFAALAFALMLFGIAILVVELRTAPDADGNAALWVLIPLYGVLTLMLLVVVVLNLIAARNLAGRRGYALCRTIAIVNMVNAPLGTALGVWTWLVLAKPPVRAAFGEPVAAQATQADRSAQA